MSYSYNSNINKEIVDKSVKKPQLITIHTPGVDDVSILSKKLETSMSIIPNK